MNGAGKARRGIQRRRELTWRKTSDRNMGYKRVHAHVVRGQRTGIEDVMQMDELVVSPLDVQKEVRVLVRRDPAQRDAKTRDNGHGPEDMLVQRPVGNMVLEREHQGEVRCDAHGEGIIAIAHGQDVRPFCNVVDLWEGDHDSLAH